MVRVGFAAGLVFEAGNSYEPIAVGSFLLVYGSKSHGQRRTIQASSTATHADRKSA
jgi:hypothetical protein